MEKDNLVLHTFPGLTDRDLIERLSPVKQEDVMLDEMGLYDPNSPDKKRVGVVLVEEGNNGKTHGQKGHKKAYLYFNFNMKGTLSDISVYVPSAGASFKFLENTAKDIYDTTQ